MRGKITATNILGLISILACLTLVGGFLFAVPGLVCGYLARTDVTDPKMKSQLRVGLVLCWIGFALAVAGLVYLMLFADWK